MISGQTDEDKLETLRGSGALDAFIKVGKKFDILGKTRQEIIDRFGM